MYECERPEMQRRNRALRTGSLKLGTLGRHVSEDHIAFLERSVPEGMTVAEYLVEGLLADAIAEDSA